jgi:hypothetical protein
VFKISAIKFCLHYNRVDDQNDQSNLTKSR